jgi:DNA-binding transcriptional ArsR family regulator
MLDTPDLASIAALVGEPTRARMLAALMDGRAWTATELALAGGVTPSTASSHLARLTGAGLLAITRQGRHRYFRIAAPEVAAAIEGLTSLAARGRAPAPRPGPRDEGLRRARVCYDHLAGEAAVRLLERMRARGLVAGEDDALALTARGEGWCARIGIDLRSLRATRRRLCRACLDWSERRTHLAGALGAALLDRMLALRYARRAREGRVVILSPRGEAFVERLELAP